MTELDAQVSAAQGKKARRCRRFAQRGSCKFSDQCAFRHDVDVASSSGLLQGVSSMSLNEDSPSGSGNQLSTSPSNADPSTTSVQSELTQGTQRVTSEKVTILSQDKTKSWSFNSEELTASSPLWTSIIAYRTQSLTQWIDDPCDKAPGVCRTHRGWNEFQLVTIDEDAFQLLVNVLRAPAEFVFPIEDLKTVLRLAADWEMESVRRRAKQGLDNAKLSAFEKLNLSRRCNDSEWTKEAYLDFATRLAPLTVREIEALGAEAATAVVLARERVLIQRLQGLPFRQPRQWKCQISCRQAMRDAWETVLQDGGHSQLPELAVHSLLLSGDIAGGHSLCEKCTSDEELARALEEREVANVVAIEAMEQILGSW